jgi:PAT family beta-lactamase induction signal transducer AmpG
LTAAAALPGALVLVANRPLRLAVVFFLYAAQGLPAGLFYFALPAWQAQNGASAAAIGGVLALAALPWSLKLVNGFFMDRFAFLAMGRRRPWIIVGQCGLLIGMVTMAIVNPGARDAALLGGFAFAINLASSIQDVAVDGLAVDVIPTEELGRANGFMFGGSTIGVATGAALTGGLIASRGLPTAMLALAVLIAVILAVVLLVVERPGERRLPWSLGEADPTSLDRHLGSFGAIVRGVLGAMNDRPTLIALPALFLTGVSYALFIGLAPLHGARALGWVDATYANWSARANLAAGIAGVLVLGSLASRWGARRSFIGAHLASAIAAALLVLLLPGSTAPALLIASIFAFSAIDIMRSIAASAVAMRLCTPAVAATQFSLMMAIWNIGISAGSATLGTLDGLGGTTAMAAAIIVSGTIGAGFAALAKAGR